MKEGYRLLGDFIQPVDERNRDLKVDYLLGVSISKQFPPLRILLERTYRAIRLFVLGNLRMVLLHLGMARRFRLLFYKIRIASFQAHIPCLRSLITSDLTLNI